MEVSCKVTCNSLLLLKRQFLCGYNLNLCNFDYFFDHLSDLNETERECHLDSLLNNTISNPLISKYPLRLSYLKYFLKLLLEKAESINCNYSLLYELYIDILQRHNEAQCHYKHFCVGSEVVSVLESVSAISNGTTGGSVWQGGIALADWCIDNTPLLMNQNILELGCGVGLTGLIVCLSDCRPHSYCFTDAHPNVLKFVETNFNLNSVRERSNASITSLLLDWTRIGDFSESYMPNVILGADIVFDPEIFPSLCRTLKHLLQNENNVSYLSCTVRNNETYVAFIEELLKNNMQVVKETRILPKRFDFPSEPPVILIEVKHKL